MRTAPGARDGPTATQRRLNANLTRPDNARQNRRSSVEQWGQRLPAACRAPQPTQRDKGKRAKLIPVCDESSAAVGYVRVHRCPGQPAVDAPAGGVGEQAGEGQRWRQLVFVAELGGSHPVGLLDLGEVRLGGHQHTWDAALHEVLLSNRWGEGQKTSVEERESSLFVGQKEIQVNFMTRDITAGVRRLQELHLHVHLVELQGAERRVVIGVRGQAMEIRMGTLTMRNFSWLLTWTVFMA
ncbi:hypothetical protein EYF80_047028 [Liparis tanakae]|uniref:Uncharacterized protein n=1 Tax=Liparis tanakae TaxID=230148 RepID=A0A4Z2FNR3_9TELE|nr:hypothetical protein EYF80_047028 [Liparis tanakae]